MVLASLLNPGKSIKLAWLVKEGHKCKSLNNKLCNLEMEAMTPFLKSKNNCNFWGN
jgi:hypothetical protein